MVAVHFWVLAVVYMQSQIQLLIPSVGIGRLWMYTGSRLVK
jgi:hypothetical protein